MVFIDTSNSQAAIKAAQSGYPGRAVGAGDTETETSAGWWQRPSHQWLLLPSALTGNKCCFVLHIKPLQWLHCLGSAFLLGNAAVQTCVLGVLPDGIFFPPLFVLCLFPSF